MDIQEKNKMKKVILFNSILVSVVILALHHVTRIIPSGIQGKNDKNYDSRHLIMLFTGSY